MLDRLTRAAVISCLLTGLWACGDEEVDLSIPAEGIGRLGDPRPNATPLQRVTFRDGEAVAKRRFSPDEAWTTLYPDLLCWMPRKTRVWRGRRRCDFFIHGQVTSDGAFIPGGERGGILSAYGLDPIPLRPGADEAQIPSP